MSKQGSCFSQIKIFRSHFTQIYTDRSKDNNRVGCVAIFKDAHLKQCLHANSSNFTAEFEASDLALDTVTEDRDFILISDSQYFKL